MWLKKSQSDVQTKMSEGPVVPSSPMVARGESDPRGVWLTAREAKAVSSLLRETSDASREARRAADRGLAELRQSSLLVATALAEEMIKLRKTQQIATAAVGIIRNCGVADLKTQLANALKDMKDTETSLAADTRKELIAKYARVSEADALEEALEKLPSIDDTASDDARLEKALALLSNLQAAKPTAVPSENAFPAQAPSSPRPEHAATREAANSNVPGTPKPRVARFADVGPSTSGSSMGPSNGRASPLLASDQGGSPLPSPPSSLKSSSSSISAKERASPLPSPPSSLNKSSSSSIITDGTGESFSTADGESSRPTARPPTEVLTPYVEVSKFSSQYDPDAKFERAQPGVFRGLDQVKPSGILPKMGRKEVGGGGGGGGGGGSGDSKAPYTGSACPVCSTRFPDQPSLIAHIETCAASRPYSPMAPTREAPQPTQSKAASLLRKVSDFTANATGGSSRSPRAGNGADSAPLTGASSGGGFVSGPTNFSHEAHTTEGLKTTTPAVRKVPRKPAPAPPPNSKRPPPNARSRSKTGGAGRGRGAAPLPVTRKAPTTRVRSMSMDSAVEETADDENDEEEEMFVEIVLHSGEVTLQALNLALGSKTAADSEILVIVRLGKGYKRQLEPLRVSTTLGFRKDQAVFSSVDDFDLQVSVGLFLTGRTSNAREMIGKVEIGLQQLLELQESVTLPIHGSNRHNGEDVGRISLAGAVKTRKFPMNHRYQYLNYHRPPKSIEEPLTKSMSSARYSMTVGLAVPIDGQSLAAQASDPDPLVAAYESWPIRFAECCRLITEGHPLPSIGHLNSLGQSLLHITAMYGDVAAMQVLLDATSRNERDQFVNVFDRNKKDRRLFSPLHYAVIYENTDCIRLLVKSGARIDGAFRALEPIHMAALLGKDEVVRVLLDLGADRDAPDYNSKATPVFYAAFGGFISVVDTLLSKGAFLDAEDRNGMTALLVAGVAENVPVIVNLMQRSVKPVMSSYDGRVMLPWTVLNAEHPELRELLQRFKKDTLVAKYPLYDRTLLMRSILTLTDEALMESVTALLSLAAGDRRFVNAQDEFGKTALHYACMLSHDMVVRRLIEAGAVVNMRDNADNTPLHVCLSTSSAEILLQNGANVNDVNGNRNTPLHLASALGLLELRALYKGWGAKEMRNEQGKPPKEVLNLVPPKHYKLQIKMGPDDPYDEDSGGIVLRN